jgi:translocation and assembly module TamB
MGRGFALQLEELAVTANLAPSAITFEARVRSALATVAAEGSVGAVGAAAIPYNSTSPLAVSAQADIARLAPLAAFIDTTMLLGGKAAARVQVGGTLGKPDVTGRITGQNLTLALPTEGMSLTDGSLVATLTASEIQLDSFSIRGGQGVLTASGTLAREAFDTASVDWRAERFMPLARPDRRIVVTGQGNAALKQGKLSITGKLRANEGEFEIAGSESLPTLSSDVVVDGGSPGALKPGSDAPPRFNGLVLDLNIDLGDQVHITGHGLSVWLAGDLRVFTNAQGEIRASGTVNARNGTIRAYGQRLEIDRGQLLFNGAIADPALDILATRRRQAVEAGVAVTGMLRAPLIRIVSDPPLPQGEALAWLVLGRPASAAGPGELSALPLASGLLAGKLSNPIAQRLRLDELGVGGSAGGQFVTLGKRITDRLNLVFQQGLGAAESLLRLEYTLTRRVLLRLQAGEPTSAGIVYRRSWDCGPQISCNPSGAK